MTAWLTAMICTPDRSDASGRLFASVAIISTERIRSAGHGRSVISYTYLASSSEPAACPRRTDGPEGANALPWQNASAQTERRCSGRGSIGPDHVDGQLRVEVLTCSVSFAMVC